MRQIINRFLHNMIRMIIPLYQYFLMCTRIKYIVHEWLAERAQILQSEDTSF